MAKTLLVASLLWASASVIRVAESVDYDGDHAIPVEILSAPLWTDGPDGTSSAKLWSNRTAIPYAISDTLAEEHQRLIKRALRTMERSTDACVLFKKRTDERNYLYFMNTTTHASVGMQGGYQIVPYNSNSGDSDATVMGNMLHQIMCALGFPHEQQRPDRNDYIEINYDQVQNGNAEELKIRRDMHTFGTKYDYRSIMHSGAYSYAKSTRPVIVPKKGLIIQAGIFARLSPGDIAKIKRAYKCPMRISHQDNKQAKVMEPFPKFSLEPMSYEKCRLQYNDYCTPTESISNLCGVDSSRKDFQIRCVRNTEPIVLEQMSLSMAQGELRPVSIFLDASNQSLLSQLTFDPIRMQVLLVSLWYCTGDRTTGWLSQTKFPNLLQLELYGCHDLAVTRNDFAYSRKLRVIVFNESTIKALGRDTFNNLPELRILSLEALWNSSSSRSEYGKFDQRMQTYLYNIHCSCEFAWFRSWWTNSKQLKMKVDRDELYSIPGGYGNGAYKKEELYHPIDCAASTFPAGVEWINYYTQVKYSISEPKCEKVQRCQNVLQALVTDCF